MVYLIFLICSVFFSSGYSQETNPDVSLKIGSITILRGDSVFVYSAGEKKTVSEKEIPYIIYSGDEVNTTSGSHCEVVLYSGSTIYVGPETLMSIEKKGEEIGSMFLKYGLVMFRGVNPVDFRVSDIHTRTVSGDFIARYKKIIFELTFLNFGEAVYVKQTDDKTPSKVLRGGYIDAVSFKNQKRFGLILPSAIPGLYEKFKVPFKPEGPSFDVFSPAQTKELKKENDAKVIDVDKIKRVTGF